MNVSPTFCRYLIPPRIVLHKTNGLFTACLLLLASPVGAQDKKVTGKVVNEADDNPLSTGSFIIKGTIDGTSTDANGAFTISANRNRDTWVFTFVGCVIKEVPLGGKIALNVGLKGTDINMDDVIVVGYGTQKRSEVIGALATVKRPGFRYTYVWAQDKEGIYLVDGYKTVTIDVNPNFAYYINRYVYDPDSITKTNECYLVLTTGETFNYTNGAANAAKIDMGLYSTVTPPPAMVRAYYIYSLSTPTLPFNIYDVGNWTTTVTLCSIPKTGQATAFQAIRTASTLVSLAKAATPNQKTITTGLVAGVGFYFVTPESKYGAELINQVGTDDKGKFVNVSIKVQQ